MLLGSQSVRREDLITEESKKQELCVEVEEEFGKMAGASQMNPQGPLGDRGTLGVRKRLGGEDGSLSISQGFSSISENSKLNLVFKAIKKHLTRRKNV